MHTKRGATILRPRHTLVLAIWLAVLVASDEPPQTPIVWKNLFAKAPTISRSTTEVQDEGMDLVGEPLEDKAPDVPSPEELPSAGDAEEFGPGLEKIRDAFAKANSNPQDKTLKSLKDWDFMPTVGKDESNSFYFGRNQDDAAVLASGRALQPDDALAAVPDAGGSTLKQRMAMALCKQVQFNQPDYALSLIHI